MGSPAPALPDQTAVNFLRAGNADRFSAECQKLLAEAGYKPEWFGSYNHTANQIRKAKDACDTFDKTLKPGEAPPNDKPSKEERYLARCWSGHLTQDAVYRESGGRGNPCKNVGSAPGYDMSWAPCMPMEGDPGDPRTEHGLVTKHEQDSAAGAEGRKPGAPIAEGEIAAASDERAKKLVADREAAKISGRNVTKPQAGQEGASASGGAQSGPKAGEASGATGGEPSKPNTPWRDPIQGKTAADCINAFRKAAEAAMRERCKGSVARNRAIANGKDAKTEADGEKYRQDLKDKAAAARAEAENDPDNEEKKKAAEKAQRKSSRAEYAKCRADQGQYLLDGTQPKDRNYSGPPFDGVTPSNASPPQTGGTVSGKQSV